MRLSREVRQAAIAARNAAAHEEKEENEVEDFSDNSEYVEERFELSRKKADTRRENRQIKRAGARKLRALEIADSGKDKPCVTVSEHYFAAGEMVKLRNATPTVGLVLDTADRVISYWPCGSPREVAKCETLQVLVSGEICTWKSRMVLPVH